MMKSKIETDKPEFLKSDLEKEEYRQKMLVKLKVLEEKNERARASGYI